MPTTTWHTLNEIVGFGPAITQELHDRGYQYSESLLRYSRNNIANALSGINGLTVANVKNNYCIQALLLRLPDMTGTISNTLVNAGFNYSRLTYTPVDVLLKLLAKKGHSVSKYTALSWQLDASKRRFSSAITVVVLDQNGDPVPDASVYVDDPALTGDSISWHWKSNEQGHALVEYLIPGQHTIVAIKDEKHTKHSVNTSHCQYLSIKAVLSLTAPNGITYDEHVSGPVMQEGPSITVKCERDDLNDGEILEVTSTNGNEYRLTRILRQQKGSNWYISSLNIPKNNLSHGLNLHDLVEYKNSQFTYIAGTSASVRQAMRNAILVNQFSAALGG